MNLIRDFIEGVCDSISPSKILHFFNYDYIDIKTCNFFLIHVIGGIVIPFFEPNTVTSITLQLLTSLLSFDIDLVHTYKKNMKHLPSEFVMKNLTIPDFIPLYFILIAFYSTPWNWVAIPLVSIMYPLKVFEFSWDYHGKKFDWQMNEILSNIWYYLGFGFPASIVYYYLGSPFSMGNLFGTMMVYHTGVIASKAACGRIVTSQKSHDSIRCFPDIV